MYILNKMKTFFFTSCLSREKCDLTVNIHTERSARGCAYVGENNEKSYKDIFRMNEDLKGIIFVLVLLCKCFSLLLMYQCGWTVPINICI